MRLQQLGRVRPVDTAAHPRVFTGERGEGLQISVLDAHLVRVQHWTDAQGQTHVVVQV